STITTNSQARFKVAWSATGLHAHVHVVDPVLRVEEPSMEYQGDNVQFFIQGAEPAGGSPLLSGSTAYIKAADVPSEPQQIFLVPKAGSYAGSSRLSVPWSTTGFESATRQVSDGYEIEIFYPWPDAVAPMTASKVIGLDFMVGVNDDASPSSTREFEYGLYLGNVSNSSCGSYSSYNAPWCDNGLWCTPTTAD
ncbi:MAG TPA: hypothetical protein VLC09_12000, partial [Polyangiaceae bacterium]|nr:hypothetical protein [Polyangiaceae bacterium]